jgi:hypothetical protein
MAKSRDKERVFAVLLSGAFTLGPFGFSVPIRPACLSWSFAWICLLFVVWEYLPFTAPQKFVIAVIATSVITYAAYPAIHKSYIKERASALSGDLVAQDDGKDHTTDPPVLQIGPGGQMMTWLGDPNVAPISAYYDKIQMKMVKGRVFLSTTVHDDAKNLIVEITDNHWIVSSSTASCWDKNYTDDSLEVRDGHGRVVLQVKLMPNIVQLQEEWQWNPGTKNGSISETGWYDEKEGIKHLFRYPSELYWGQRRDSPGY